MKQKQENQTKESIQPLSSVPLQTFLYFDYIYGWIYFIFQIIIFFYKGYGLFYPPSALGIEVFILVMFILCQFTRIYMGTVGNKTESSSTLLWFIILCLPCGFAYAFFMRLQTYVLMVELLLGVIGCIFLIFEFIFGVLALSNFKKHQ